SPSPPPGRPEVVSLFPPKPAATQGPTKGPPGRSAPHGACGMRSAPPRDSSVATPSSRSPPVVPCCIPFARSVLPANAGRAFVGSAPHTVSMDAWPRCLERLEAEFPAEDVHTWLKPLQASLRDDAFVLYAPNAFVMEEVRSRYLDRIRELLSHFAGSDQVSLEIGSLRKKPAPAPASVPPTRPAAAAETFQGHLDSHYTFENFVEGRSNQLGRAAAWQAAQKPGDRAHNPLLLYGGTGLGKTHLMFAAGNAMRANNPGMRVMYMRSEQFMSAFTKALYDKTSGGMEAFKRQFQGIDALLID